MFNPMQTSRWRHRELQNALPAALRQSWVSEMSVLKKLIDSDDSVDNASRSEGCAESHAPSEGLSDHPNSGSSAPDEPRMIGSPRDRIEESVIELSDSEDENVTAAEEESIGSANTDDPAAQTTAQAIQHVCEVQDRPKGGDDASQWISAYDETQVPISGDVAMEQDHCIDGYGLRDSSHGVYGSDDVPPYGSDGELNEDDESDEDEGGGDEEEEEIEIEEEDDSDNDEDDSDNDEDEEDSDLDHGDDVVDDVVDDEVSTHGFVAQGSETQPIDLLDSEDEDEYHSGDSAIHSTSGVDADPYPSALSNDFAQQAHFNASAFIDSTPMSISETHYSQSAELHQWSMGDPLAGPPPAAVLGAVLHELSNEVFQEAVVPAHDVVQSLPESSTAPPIDPALLGIYAESPNHRARLSTDVELSYSRNYTAYVEDELDEEADTIYHRRAVDVQTMIGIRNDVAEDTEAMAFTSVEGASAPQAARYSPPELEVEVLEEAGPSMPIAVPEVEVEAIDDPEDVRISTIDPGQRLLAEAIGPAVIEAPVSPPSQHSSDSVSETSTQPIVLTVASQNYTSGGIHDGSHLTEQAQLDSCQSESGQMANLEPSDTGLDENAKESVCPQSLAGGESGAVDRKQTEEAGNRDSDAREKDRETPKPKAEAEVGEVKKDKALVVGEAEEGVDGVESVSEERDKEIWGKGVAVEETEEMDEEEMIQSEARVEKRREERGAELAMVVEDEQGEDEEGQLVPEEIAGEGGLGDDEQMREATKAVTEGDDQSTQGTLGQPPDGSDDSDGGDEVGYREATPELKIYDGGEAYQRQRS